MFSLSTVYCSALINASYCTTFAGLSCTACAVGYVVQSTYCVACTSGCSACTIIPSTCTACSLNYFLYLSSCLTTCPSGTFADAATSTCLPCSIAPIYCSTCTAANQCTKCLTTFTGVNVYSYRANAYDTTVTCSLGACSSISLYADSQQSCYACDASCIASGCYGPTSSNCSFVGISCAPTDIRKADLTCMTRPLLCSYPITSPTQSSCCPAYEY